jgi:predicted DNA-binding protein
MKGEKNSTHVSIQMSYEEKRVLDEAVKESGLTRNRFLRNFIDSLRKTSK